MQSVIGPDEGTSCRAPRFLGAELLIQNIGGYLDGSNRPIPKMNRGATYAPIDRNEVGSIGIDPLGACIIRFARWQSGRGLFPFIGESV